MDSLIQAGLLKPGLGGDMARPRFTEADIDAFRQQIESFPLLDRMQAKPAGFETISFTAKRHHVTTATVYALLLSGEIGGTIRCGNGRIWTTIMVQQKAADRHFRSITESDLRISHTTVASYLNMSAKFLRLLAERGYFSIERAPHPATGLMRMTMSKAEVQTFQEGYMTMREASLHTEEIVRIFQKRLPNIAATPVEWSEDRKECLWRRREIASSLADIA